MGRHSRRGPAPKDDSAATAAQRREQDPGAEDPGRVRRPAQLPGQRRAPEGAPRRAPGQQEEPGEREGRQGPDGRPQGPEDRSRGARDRQQAPGAGRLGSGARRAAPGEDRSFDGTPARGVRRLTGGTPARGVPRLSDGASAHGVPQAPGGTPRADARGGHPEQWEAGGGWGEFPRRAASGGEGASGAGRGEPGPGAALPRQGQGQRRTGPGGPGDGGRGDSATTGDLRGPGRFGPRQEDLDAFDEDLDVFAARPAAGAPRTTGTGEPREPHGDGAGTAGSGSGDGTAPRTGVPAQPRGGRGRTFTGIAAAAVTTVLAVVVAGQVTHGRESGDGSRSAGDGRASDARGAGRATPSAAPSAAVLTYEQKMARTYPLSATLKGSGKFEAVPGFAKAPGTGQKFRYRVDVERGLGLDAELFAQAVQKTLNDDRSWAHGGARTFERVSSGEPDFVITLASPGTTAQWCAKSGLDTTEDNVSCDSAATERVMINAYRWAQGSTTYGDEIHAYRQMLINHEVGHRLGHGHVTCDKDGELAPVMQQQTKFLDHDGIHCLPNPWPYPGR
ncbi:DUF3152 domain-containing protein [Streptomyces sp. TG1A-8]|uniref:DUF3152 domain-containing protein n=1 Tax=Streptomyces sp. TG1A-8 TaxID=3051385 RepID=UPI00265C6A5A|nr:DUF3152 domain-containing protein [Streptomyces sp. TG1A-8]MDO0925837.1 DUF3152 domain-containing protein [Streptomyces sp. TG1A-8]